METISINDIKILPTFPNFLICVPNLLKKLTIAVVPPVVTKPIISNNNSAAELTKSQNHHNDSDIIVDNAKRIPIIGPIIGIPKPKSTINSPMDVINAKDIGC